VNCKTDRLNEYKDELQKSREQCEKYRTEKEKLAIDNAKLESENEKLRVGLTEAKRQFKNVKKVHNSMLKKQGRTNDLKLGEHILLFTSLKFKLLIDATLFFSLN